jgi:hypothetical protein
LSQLDGVTSAHLVGVNSPHRAQNYPTYRTCLDHSIEFVPPASSHAPSLSASSSFPIHPIGKRSSSSSSSTSIANNPTAPSLLHVSTPESKSIQSLPTLYSGSNNPGVVIDLSRSSSYQFNYLPEQPVNTTSSNMEDPDQIIRNTTVTTSTGHIIPSLRPSSFLRPYDTTSDTATDKSIDTVAAGSYDCLAGSKKSDREYSRGQTWHRTTERRIPDSAYEDLSRGRSRSRSCSRTINGHRSRSSSSDDRRNHRAHGEGGSNSRSRKERKMEQSTSRKRTRQESRSRSRSPASSIRHRHRSASHSHRNDLPDERGKKSRTSSSSAQGSSRLNSNRSPPDQIYQSSRDDRHRSRPSHGHLHGSSASRTREDH